MACKAGGGIPENCAFWGELTLGVHSLHLPGLPPNTRRCDTGLLVHLLYSDKMIQPNNLDLTDQILAQGRILVCAIESLTTERVGNDRATLWMSED
jgi:hypothetical protein